MTAADRTRAVCATILIWLGFVGFFLATALPTARTVATTARCSSARSVPRVRSESPNAPLRIYGVTR